MTFAPQTSSDYRYRVGEGRQLFLIPSGCAHRLALTFKQEIAHQGHQREQPQQQRRAARYRQPVPLPLRLHAKMNSRFFKGHFHPPASHEPRQHLQGRVRKIRRHQRLRLKLAERVTHNQPADSNRRLTALVPDGCLAMHLDFALAASIPLRDLDFRPLPVGWS